MELFVVNRHDNSGTEKEEENSQNEEARKLNKVLKHIEKRRLARLKLKEKKETVRKHIKERNEKKIKKTQIVNTPSLTQDEFIDKEMALPADEENIGEKQEKLQANSVEGFTILGVDNFNKKAKVKRVLPKWLSNPTIISVNLQNLEVKVSDIKLLDKSLRKKLKENGIQRFFPVQAKVVPWLLEAHKHSDIIFPSDVCVSAPTGSGKTLAFVLPLIQALKNHSTKQIRALVILPTQDLAVQVFTTFRKYAECTNLDVGLITGKSPFSNEQKQLVSENKAFGHLSRIDILVCTAGRLVDHLKYTKGFNLQYLEFLVIDEADRVLDNVQNDWLYHLEKHISSEGESNTGKILNLNTLRRKKPPQKLLFSATLSQDPEKLQKLSLFQPKLFTSVVEADNDDDELPTQEISQTFIGKYTTPKELTEKYIVCSSEIKPLVLYEFVKSHKLTKTLIFTHSWESAHRLALLLKILFENELKIEEISSTLDPKIRNTSINKFSEGSIDLLVCTDSLARGMDFANVQCVISYSAPKHLKTYIHRAGRTARAGEQGLAVTMLNNTQIGQFQKILQQANKQNVTEIDIPDDSLETLTEHYQKALDKLKQVVEEEQQKNLKKLKLSKRSLPIKRKRHDSVENSKNK